MRIDHIAHLCRNPHLTHRFYSDVLGLKLVNAYAGKELMMIYELPQGGSLVFTTGGRETDPPARDLWERQHVGLTVETRPEFDRWLSTLKQTGIPFQVTEDERIYFSDPDGLVLELEVASSISPDPTAPEIVARWHSR